MAIKVSNRNRPQEQAHELTVQGCGACGAAAENGRRTVEGDGGRRKEGKRGGRERKKTNTTIGQVARTAEVDTAKLQLYLLRCLPMKTSPDEERQF